MNQITGRRLAQRLLSLKKIDLRVVEELVKLRVPLAKIHGKIGSEVPYHAFREYADGAIQRGRSKKPPVIPIVRPVLTVITDKKSKKHHSYIGQPRKKNSTYVGEKKCGGCGNNEWYKSTDTCVNCVRHYAAKYSRKINSGKHLEKREHVVEYERIPPVVKPSLKKIYKELEA